MIFSKPIQDLGIADIETFCQEGVKEGFNLEYKRDFMKDLHKEICAFANTWGGVVLVGIDEDTEGKPVLPIDGISFQKGLDVRVTNIIINNIHPPVFAGKQVIKFKKDNDDRAVIVIEVPESNMAPHSVDHGRSIYIRTDDRKTPIKRASVEEIEWLLERRKKSIQFRELLYSTAIERSKHLPQTLSCATFSAVPLYPRQAFAGTSELRAICRRRSVEAEDRYGSVIERFPDGVDRVTMTKDSVFYHRAFPGSEGALYYEFNKYGLFFYQEPVLLRARPQGVDYFVLDNILTRLDLVLETTKKFYDELNVFGLIEVKLSIDNIFKKRMVAQANDSLDNNWVSHDSDFEASLVVYKDQLMQQRLNIIKSIMRELGFAFNVEVSDSWVEEVIKRIGRFDIEY